MACFTRKQVRRGTGTLAIVLAACAGACGGSAPRAGSAAPHRVGRPARVATTVRELGRPGPPRPVPILMYHVISAPLPTSPYPDLYVPRAQFADEMGALRRAGYAAVTLQQVWSAWHAHGPLPRRPLVVSFDDGYRSDATHALPVLRGLGWPGVLNLELKNIRSDYGLTDGQVRELIAAGWEVDSHTIDHPDLTTVDAGTLTREVSGSRAELEHRFHVPARFFCYPAGRYDATVEAAVKRAGYLAATTTSPGLAQPTLADRWALDRVRVDGGTSGATLVAQLAALGAAR